MCIYFPYLQVCTLFSFLYSCIYYFFHTFIYLHFLLLVMQNKSFTFIHQKYFYMSYWLIDICTHLHHVFMTWIGRWRGWWMSAAIQKGCQASDHSFRLTFHICECESSRYFKWDLVIIPSNVCYDKNCIILMRGSDITCLT